MTTEQTRQPNRGGTMSGPSSYSRRALLGYSGSAAAGAVLASSSTAQAATAVSASAESGSEAAAVEFPPGTEFSGSSGLSVEAEDA